jgi:hypothetical protein
MVAAMCLTRSGLTALAALFLFVGAAQAQPVSIQEEEAQPPIIREAIERYGSIPAGVPGYDSSPEEGASVCYRYSHGPGEYCPPLQRCPVGIVETQKPAVRCYPTPFSAELEVQQYAKHRKVENGFGWRIAVQLKGPAQVRNGGNDGQTF